MTIFYALHVCLQSCEKCFSQDCDPVASVQNALTRRSPRRQQRHICSGRHRVTRRGWCSWRGRCGRCHRTKHCSWCRRQLASCDERVHNIIAVRNVVAADARGHHGSFANVVDHDHDCNVVVSAGVHIRGDGDRAAGDRRHVGCNNPHDHRVINRNSDRYAVRGALRVDLVNDADMTDVARHKTGDLGRDGAEVDRVVALDGDGVPNDDRCVVDGASGDEADLEVRHG